MKAPRKTAVQLGVVAPKDPAVNEFVGVLGELKSLIAEENDLLSQGLPASMLETTGEKEQLSKKYGALGTSLVTHAGRQILSDGALHEKLLEATAQLKVMTEENRQLLTNALAATRRRVDNVMDAIRAYEDDAEKRDDLPPVDRR